MTTSAQDVRLLLKRYGDEVDGALDTYLRAQGDSPLYNMMRYFLGFTDTQFRAVPQSVGKRVRPALTLLCAEAYGVKALVAPAALAIELFHNFSLIHDDIEDRDEMRRGRETVWKLWGINHAINTGDVQLILANELLAEGARTNTVSGAEIAVLLTRAFREVGEGQYLDFMLIDQPLDDMVVCKQEYLRMITKKTSALIAASVEVAAVAAGKGTDECGRAREFGMTLGIAYQLYDDVQSLWGSDEETGKKTKGDIRERKRTFLFLSALERAPGAERETLRAAYLGKDELSDAAVEQLFAIIDRSGARTEVETMIRTYKERALTSARSLELPESTRATLEALVHAFVPVR